MSRDGSERLDEGWKREGWARTYLTGIRGGIPLLAEQMDVMARLVSAACGGPASVLDLGCGDGALAAALVEGRPGARATLVDFSPPMLGLARARFSGHPSKVDFVAADFGDPGWVGLVEGFSSFDAVVSGYAIHHQTDERKMALYREIYGLLRPGGIFINMEHVASPTAWVGRVAEGHFDSALGAFQERAGSPEGFPAEELAERRGREAHVLAPVEDQCRWLRDIGFTDVDCFFKVFELALFGGRRPGGPAGGAGGAGGKSGG
ncbi:MAG: class I SAM-dependent methyltransferase [Thermodesulfobacteriota bacterium]